MGGYFRWEEVLSEVLWEFKEGDGYFWDRFMDQVDWVEVVLQNVIKKLNERSKFWKWY